MPNVLAMAAAAAAVVVAVDVVVVVVVVVITFLSSSSSPMPQLGRVVDRARGRYVRSLAVALDRQRGGALGRSFRRWSGVVRYGFRSFLFAISVFVLLL